MRLIQWQEYVAIGAVVALFVGCGGSGNPFDSVPVSGRVMYEDGSPVPVQGIKLYFHSQLPPQEGKHPRPATVGVGSDGSFKDITTYKHADGLVLGKHKVTLVVANAERVADKIPIEYTKPETSPLFIEVTKSGQVLEIKIPKP
jgi:hypothetical protein